MAFFSKPLSHCDVTQKFTVPVEWLGTLLPNIEQGSKTTIRVIDQTGANYHFVLKARSTRDDQPYLKPVFQSRGWLQFVRDHGLGVEDTVYFWKERRGNEDIIRVQEREPPNNIQFLLGYALYN